MKKKGLLFLFTALFVTLVGLFCVCCTNNPGTQGGGLLTQESHDYCLTDDYKFSNLDYKAVNGTDNVILLDYSCTFDLNGKQLDLNGYCLTIDTDEDCEIVFSNGKITGGNLKINVPNGEIRFEAVEIDASVNSELTAAPSTVHFTNVKALGKLSLLGNTHMILSNSDLTDFALLGAASVELKDGSNVETLTGEEESQGAEIVVAENATVKNAVLSAIVNMDIAGTVTSLQVNETPDAVIVDIKVVIVVRVTAVIKTMTVAQESDITVDGKVEDLQVNAPSQVEVKGKVNNFDVAETAEGSDIAVAEKATVYNVIINAVVEINVYGSVSLLEVAENAKDAQTQNKIIVVIHVTAIVTKVEIADVADVQIGGKVETVEVAPTENIGDEKPKVEITESAVVKHVEVSAVIDIVIKGDVNDVVIGEQAEGLILDLVGQAVISQLISDAQNVQVNAEVQVVIEVIYVIDVQYVSLPENFTDSIILVEQTVIEQMLAHRHTYTISEEKAATCTEGGIVTYVCSCGATREDVGEMKDHDFVETENVAATCMSDGHITEKCTHCGEEKTTILATIPHELTEISRTPATCTQNGLVSSVCMHCNQSFETVTRMLDHEYYVVEYETPTCTQEGKLVYECAHCQRQYETITNGEHNYEIKNIQSATCTQDGSITYECSVCHDSYNETIAAGAGHDYHKTQSKAATTEEEGYNVYTCSVCEDSYTVTLPKRNTGSYVLLIQNNIPWGNNDNVLLFNRLVEKEYISGWDIATTAEIASMDLSAYSSIYIANDQTSQSYTELEAATTLLTAYVENGGTLIYGACDNGWAGGKITFLLLNGVTKGNYYSRYNYINNSSSYIVTGELTDGLALTEQLLQGTYCSHTYFNKNTLPQGTDVILTDGNGNATLAEYAYGNGNVILSGLTWEFYYYRTFNNGTDTTYSKNVFDDLIVYSVALSEGRVHVHEFDTGVVVQPTCTEDGYTVHTCTICEKSYKTNAVDALGHDYRLGSEKAATCTSEGYREFTCDRCNHSYKEVIEKVAHDYDVNILVKPTVEQKGSASIVCNDCGKTIMVALPSYNEDAYTINVVEPVSCEQDGIIDGVYVTDGAQITVRFILRATGHNISNGTCTRCGLRVAATFDGRIYKVDSDANISNNVSLSDVDICVSGTDEKGNTVEMRTTSVSGRYSFTNLPFGSYTLTATLSGYKTYTQAIVVRTNPQTLGDILMTSESNNSAGTATGYARNAATNYGISGLTVYVRSGAANVTGEFVAKLTTNSSGYYTTSSLPVGYYTLQFVDERTLSNEKSRFSTGTLNIAILGGSSVVNNILLNNSEILSADSIRIVLTWGSTPKDLDSHLKFGSSHVYHGAKSLNGAKLDVDDMDGYGPETITISTIQKNTTYKYYVYNFSGGDISTSNAVVKIYLGNSSEPYYTLNVPTTSGRYWHVFEYNTETGFKFVNQTSSDAM